jgi:hypothetical protein
MFYSGSSVLRPVTAFVKVVISDAIFPDANIFFGGGGWGEVGGTRVL